LRGNFHSPTFFKIGAVEAAQTELGVADAMQEQRTNMRL
jgi:hypothetical protein